MNLTISLSSSSPSLTGQQTSILPPSSQEVNKSFPFSLLSSDGIRRKILMFLPLEDLLTFSRTSSCCNILAKQVMGKHILASVNFLKEIDSNNFMKYSQFSWRTIDNLEKTGQHFLKDPSQITFSSLLHIFSAVYPLLHREIAGNSTMGPFFRDYIATPNAILNGMEEEFSHLANFSFPLFLQKCETSHFECVETEKSDYDRPSKNFKVEHKKVELKEKKENISYKAAVIELLALNLFADEANLDVINERLTSAMAIELKRREEENSQRAFSGFFVFRPSSQFGCLTLHCIDFETKQIRKRLYDHNHFSKGDLLLCQCVLETTQNKVCLLDYEKQEGIASVSKQKLTDDEWNEALKQLRIDIQTSPYYLDIPKQQVEEILIETDTFCFRPSTENGLFAVSYKDSQGVKHGTLSLNDDGQITVCGAVYDSLTHFINRLTSHHLFSPYQSIKKNN